MTHMDAKKKKQVAIIGGALVVLYVLYRYYQSRTAAAQASSAGTTDTTGAGTSTGAADYASLAGQEQSDMAAVQGQNSSLLAQEQSDVAGLAAQEQGDVSGLTAGLAGLNTAITASTFDPSSILASIAATNSEVAALASGSKPGNRAGTVATHPGGAFYKYYKRVTGHDPPAHVSISNMVYEMWKAGIKVAAPAVHPAANTKHGASRNTHVAHPNSSHTAQTHPKTKAKMPGTRKPPAKTKAKASGRRR